MRLSLVLLSLVPMSSAFMMDMLGGLGSAMGGLMGGMGGMSMGSSAPAYAAPAPAPAPPPAPPPMPCPGPPPQQSYMPPPQPQPYVPPPQPMMPAPQPMMPPPQTYAAPPPRPAPYMPPSGGGGYAKPPPSYMPPSGGGGYAKPPSGGGGGGYATSGAGSYRRRYARAAGALSGTSKDVECNSEELKQTIKNAMTDDETETRSRISAELEKKDSRMAVFCTSNPFNFIVSNSAHFCAVKGEKFSCYAFVFTD